MEEVPVVPLTRKLYKDVIEAINLIIDFREVNKKLSFFFPSISPRTLRSIYAQEYQRKTKKSLYKHHLLENAEKYYERYLSAVAAHELSGILLRMAAEIGISPSLLSRIVLEQHLIKKTPGESPTKQLMTKMLKDTSLIDNGNLALEIHLCVLNDNNYGSLADIVKHSIGYEYECKLRRILEDKKITFLGEEQMRSTGYDKTPDFKLEIPFATNGFIINWIESKALFGDEESHQIYLREQFWSYWNRFGSGLVIYWFGYLEELDSNRHKGILLSHQFPQDIIKMDPCCVK